VISWGEGGGRLECGAETFVYFPGSLAWRLQKGTTVESMIFQSFVKQGGGGLRSEVTLQNGFSIEILLGRYSNE